MSRDEPRFAEIRRDAPRAETSGDKPRLAEMRGEEPRPAEMSRNEPKRYEMMTITTTVMMMTKMVTIMMISMMMAMMIAMAMSCNPNILIADEPTTAFPLCIQCGRARPHHIDGKDNSISRRSIYKCMECRRFTVSESRPNELEFVASSESLEGENDTESVARKKVNMSEVEDDSAELDFNVEPQMT